MTTKPQPGFCLKGLCRDGTTKIYINVCGHDSVDRPATKNGESIPNYDFVDLNGIDNLLVPIAVSPAAELKAKEGATNKTLAVDVVVNTGLTERCVQTHHKYEHLIGRLTQLALQWVQQETGLVVVPSSIKMLPDTKYKDPRGGKQAPPTEAELKQHMEQIYEQLKKEGVPPSAAAAAGGEQAADEDTAIPEALKVKPQEAKAERKGPLIQELDGSGQTKPAIKRGFLNNSGARLYEDGGSKEGKVPEDTGDPLGHLPDSLRGKCQVVDARTDEEKAHRPIPQEMLHPGPAQAKPTQTAPRHTTASDISALESLLGGAIPSSQSRGTDEPKKTERDAPLSTAPLPDAVVDWAGGKTKEGENEIGDLPKARTTSEFVKAMGSEPSPPAAASTDSWQGSVKEVDATKVAIEIVPPAGVSSMQELDLEVEEDCVRCGSDFVQKLQKPIDVDSAKAKFVKKTRKLTITATLL